MSGTSETKLQGENLFFVCSFFFKFEKLGNANGKVKKTRHSKIAKTILDSYKRKRKTKKTDKKKSKVETPVAESS